MGPAPSPRKTIVVGMSGGVDSSVAAALLHEQGHRVIGLFMKNWDETDSSGACTAAQDFQDVARVCEKIGIPYYSVEFVKEYWANVFERFKAEYAAGFTPNPDILCNREIKFHFFLEKAKSLGGELLATGHYCRIGRDDQGEPTLLKGVDPGKDQSYFVYTLGRETLKQVLFPVGELEKKEVRAIAERLGLSTAKKKDSTGICFIGERDFRPFLAQYVQAQPGDFRRLDGELVGRHQGSAYYTLGQRRGLGLGGEGERWFVVAKDMKRNIVFVERGADHPALYSDACEATELSFVSGALPSEAPFRALAKIRYRQEDQLCTVEPLPAAAGTPLAERRIRIVFDEPQRAITPGQSVVFYRADGQGQECLGGGVVRGVDPSYHDRRIPLTPSRSTQSRPMNEPQLNG